MAARPNAKSSGDAGVACIGDDGAMGYDGLERRTGNGNAGGANIAPVVGNQTVFDKDGAAYAKPAVGEPRGA